MPASARAVRRESAIRLRPPAARKSWSRWVLDREEPDSTAEANSVTEAARGPNCVSRVDDCPGLTFTCGELLSRLGERRGGSRGAAGMDCGTCCLRLWHSSIVTQPIQHLTFLLYF